MSTNIEWARNPDGSKGKTTRDVTISHEPAGAQEINQRLVSELKDCRKQLMDAQSDAHFHERLYRELTEFTDEWKRRDEKAETEIEQLCKEHATPANK